MPWAPRGLPVDRSLGVWAVRGWMSTSSRERAGIAGLPFRVASVALSLRQKPIPGEIESSSIMSIKSVPHTPHWYTCPPRTPPLRIPRPMLLPTLPSTPSPPLPPGPCPGSYRAEIAEYQAPLIGCWVFTTIAHPPRGLRPVLGPYPPAILCCMDGDGDGEVARDPPKPGRILSKRFGFPV